MWSGTQAPVINLHLHPFASIFIILHPRYHEQQPVLHVNLQRANLHLIWCDLRRDIAAAKAHHHGGRGRGHVVWVLFIDLYMHRTWCKLGHGSNEQNGLWDMLNPRFILMQQIKLHITVKRFRFPYDKDRCFKANNNSTLKHHLSKQSHESSKTTRTSILAADS